MKRKRFFTVAAVAAVCAAMAFACTKDNGTATDPDDSISQAVPQPVPEVVGGFDDNGASNALFSVSEDRKVRFSRGNLQFTTTGQHATADGTARGTWRFAEHQYDIVGEDNSKASSTYGGWIDLFGWGTSGWNSGNAFYMPYDTVTTYRMPDAEHPGTMDNVGYGPDHADESCHALTDEYANADWGVYNAVSNGGNRPGMWRTLTYSEWFYLLEQRTASTVDGTKNVRYALASVDGTPGIILFPDAYSHPDSLHTPPEFNTCEPGSRAGYTAEDWGRMEDRGAIFLPKAGYRGNGGTWENNGSEIRYWTASDYYRSYAFCTMMNWMGLIEGYTPRYLGSSVRLVQDIAR